MLARLLPAELSGTSHYVQDSRLCSRWSAAYDTECINATSYRIPKYYIQPDYTYLLTGFLHLTVELHYQIYSSSNFPTSFPIIAATASTAYAFHSETSTDAAPEVPPTTFLHECAPTHSLFSLTCAQ